jgi:negative regulator of sigma E activity
MDHDATREQLDLAAAEPGGLDRLMAGDTPAAQAVAAHLAGCPECAAELARLERASSVIRTVVRELPPVDLRERTLALVRASGVPRAPTLAADGPPIALPVEIGARIAARSRMTSAFGWLAGIAAAVVLSVVVTSVIVGSRVDDQLATQAASIETLQEVAIATLRVTGEPDARRVALVGSAQGLQGDLIFSPATSELVVVATGLTPPPAGQEYRCWVKLDGERQRVGRMFFSDDLAYWIGPVPAVSGLVGDATFGVSLVDAGGSIVGPDPVLDGAL